MNELSSGDEEIDSADENRLYNDSILEDDIYTTPNRGHRQPDVAITRSTRARPASVSFPSTPLNHCDHIKHVRSFINSVHDVIYETFVKLDGYNYSYRESQIAISVVENKIFGCNWKIPVEKDRTSKYDHPDNDSESQNPVDNDTLPDNNSVSQDPVDNDTLPDNDSESQDPIDNDTLPR